MLYCTELYFHLGDQKSKLLHIPHFLGFKMVEKCITQLSFGTKCYVLMGPFTWKWPETKQLFFFFSSVNHWNVNVPVGLLVLVICYFSLRCTVCQFLVFSCYFPASIGMAYCCMNNPETVWEQPWIRITSNTSIVTAPSPPRYLPH